jgi:hypothetical protein
MATLKLVQFLQTEEERRAYYTPKYSVEVIGDDKVLTGLHDLKLENGKLTFSSIDFELETRKVD